MSTTLTSTTLSAALNNKDQAFVVASATNIVKGSVLFADGEFMKVMADPVGLFLPVVWRGWAGSTSSAHASGAVLWANPEGYYYDNDPVGNGSSTTELYLPHISYQTRSAYALGTDGQWLQFIRNGRPCDLPGGAYNKYTTAGAITLVGGTHLLNTGAASSMTLAAPGAGTPEGTILTISAADAYAYTVTYTAGFLGGTTSNDVATFGGAIGDCFTIQNIGGVWRPLAVRNVTFG